MKKKKWTRIEYSLTLYIMLCILIVSIMVLLVATIANAIGENLISGNSALLFLIIGLGIVLVISIIVSYFLNRLIKKYVTSIRSALKKISSGDFDIQFKKSKNAYINDVIEDFNSMVTDLRSVPMQRNDFISNFSHEFKTPLASVKGFAEILRDKKDLTDEERQEYLNIIIDECIRLSQLSNNTLLISKLDTQTKLNKTSKVYLDEQIDQCLFLLDNKIKEKNITVSTEFERCPLVCDENLMQQVWINIIDNAIKFTKDRISVSTKKTEDAIHIVIEDNGIGISKESQKHIFEKFYQADSSRTVEGNGLGLAIAKRIISLHNGNICVDSQKGKYTKFQIVLNTVNKGDN